MRPWQGWLPWLVLSATVIVWIHFKVNLLGQQVLPPGARMLMFLPMAHVFARLLTVLAASWPVTTAFTPDTRNLLSDLAAVALCILLITGYWLWLYPRRRA